MADVVTRRKALAVNPLKSSAPLGGALAFLGIDRCLPLFHGGQGCTAFALVLLVRHFREAIPLQTTAMNEITTILGGADNVEQAIDNIYKRAQPRLIGLCSTALTETRGEDMAGDLRLMRARRAADWPDLEVVFASTPDYTGGLQEGWAAATTAMIEALVRPECGPRLPRQVNVLAGSHLTPGDVEALREIVESFELTPIMLPDLSGSLDGHVPDRYIPTTYGGTSVDDIRRMGRSALTLAIGEHMRGPAEALRGRTGVPVRVFDRLTGIEAVDSLMVALMEASGRPVPETERRRRSQLADAMLDAHFFYGGKRVALAAEPDLLLALATLFADLGAEVGAAVSTVNGPALARVPADSVLIGDLDDLEQAAAGCDLMVTHAHGRQAAARLGIPLLRAGFPVFDRLGAAHRVSVGYRGTRDLVCEIGNILMDAEAAHHGPARHTPPHFASKEDEDDGRHRASLAAG
jgi:nitrogenase molybdenum-iron protein NifN